MQEKGDLILLLELHVQWLKRVHQVSQKSQSEKPPFDLPAGDWLVVLIIFFAEFQKDSICSKK